MSRGPRALRQKAYASIPYRFEKTLVGFICGSLPLVSYLVVTAMNLAICRVNGEKFHVTRTDHSERSHNPARWISLMFFIELFIPQYALQRCHPVTNCSGPVRDPGRAESENVPQLKYMDDLQRIATQDAEKRLLVLVETNQRHEI